VDLFLIVACRTANCPASNTKLEDLVDLFKLGVAAAIGLHGAADPR